MVDYVPTKAEIDACVTLATATADADMNTWPASMFRTDLTPEIITQGVTQLLVTAGNARASSASQRS
jgi:hypothetical protein